MLLTTLGHVLGVAVYMGFQPNYKSRFFFSFVTDLAGNLSANYAVSWNFANS